MASTTITQEERDRRHRNMLSELIAGPNRIYDHTAAINAAATVASASGNPLEETRSILDSATAYQGVGRNYSDRMSSYGNPFKDSITYEDYMRESRNQHEARLSRHVMAENESIASSRHLEHMHHRINLLEKKEKENIIKIETLIDLLSSFEAKLQDREEDHKFLINEIYKLKKGKEND